MTKIGALRFFLCVFGFLLTPANSVCFRHFSSVLSCESLSRLNLGQFYWLIGSHDTIHLKMALKTILIFLGKSSTSDKGSCSLEVDTTTSELSSNPPKKKFPHVYQDEKCIEMAVSEKSDNGMFGCEAKQMQCVTNYRIRTKGRHVRSSRCH